MTKQQKQKALEGIAKEIEKCKICKQGKVGMAVPGEGDADADIVFIGEAPGKKEAETGRPFVGRAGKLLRSLIAEVGLSNGELLKSASAPGLPPPITKNVFITSPVKYLPEYVTPKPADIEHGRKHLFEQFAVIEPKVVVLMGNVAAQAVLGASSSAHERPLGAPSPKRGKEIMNGAFEKFPIAKIHGKIIKKDNVTYFITYHPAAPLYNPNLRSELKKDFYTLKKIIS